MGFTLINTSDVALGFRGPAPLLITPSPCFCLKKKEERPQPNLTSTVPTMVTPSVPPQGTMELGGCSKFTYQISNIYICWLSVKNLPANVRDAGSIPGSGRSPEEGNGNPL